MPMTYFDLVQSQIHAFTQSTHRTLYVKLLDSKRFWFRTSTQVFFGKCNVVYKILTKTTFDTPFKSAANDSNLDY